MNITRVKTEAKTKKKGTISYCDNNKKWFIWIFFLSFTKENAIQEKKHAKCFTKLMFICDGFRFTVDIAQLVS